MKYKASFYNIVYPSSNKEYDFILANTYTSSIILADNELVQLLSEFDEHAQIRLKKRNSKILDLLQKNGFILDADLNELDRVKFCFAKSRFNYNDMHLTIVPTSDCNLACFYCYEWKKKKERMNQEIIKQTVSFVENRVGEITSLGTTWYGGEPLLEFETVEDLSNKFISVCKKAKIDYGSSMITNGTLLTNSVVKRMVRLRIGFLQITLDGPKEIHNVRRIYKSHQRESFDDIVCGIECCRGKIPVSIRINVDKTNIGAYTELLDHLIKRKLLGGDSDNSVSLGLVKNWTDVPNSLCKEPLSHKEFAVKSRELVNYLKTRNIVGAVTSSFRAKPPCGAVTFNNFLIQPDGTLRKCWISATGPTDKVGDLSSGYDFTKAPTIRWLSYDTTQDKRCAGCKLLPVCSGGCPYESMYKPEEKNHHCKFMFKYVEDGVRLAVGKTNS